jgi:hypothetical protein
VKAIRAGRSSAGRKLMNASPIAASATTTTRLTRNPCPSANTVKAFTSDRRNPGWESWLIDWVMVARLPGRLAEPPAQKPRPGHA